MRRGTAHATFSKIWTRHEELMVGEGFWPWTRTKDRFVKGCKRCDGDDAQGNHTRLWRQEMQFALSGMNAVLDARASDEWVADLRKEFQTYGGSTEFWNPAADTHSGSNGRQIQALETGNWPNRLTKPERIPVAPRLLPSRKIFAIQVNLKGQESFAGIGAVRE
ncbi:hypothetical protein K438DRAFT_1773930 [Mycena galopus ATCC 62051]|nr:hypothetical protein K438DRAFT_1773930 [Mycena galopus ATCC 62051]